MPGPKPHVGIGSDIIKGHTMSMYTKLSAQKNVEFTKAVNELVESGIDSVVAINVIRWRLANWKPNKVHARTKNYNLTPEQMTSPSLRLAIKVGRGTRPGDPMPHVAESVKWQHVIVAKSGVMYDRRTHGEFALDTYL